MLFTNPEFFINLTNVSHHREIVKFVTRIFTFKGVFHSETNKLQNF